MYSILYVHAKKHAEIEEVDTFKVVNQCLHKVWPPRYLLTYDLKTTIQVMQQTSVAYVYMT